MRQKQVRVIVTNVPSNRHGDLLVWVPHAGDRRSKVAATPDLRRENTTAEPRVLPMVGKILESEMVIHPNWTERPQWRQHARTLP